MYPKSAFHTSSVLALAIGAGQLLNCGNSGLVQGNAQVASIGQALSVAPVSTVLGLYENGKCLDPATGTPRMGVTWSAAVSNMVGANPVAVLNDTGCVLDITGLKVTDSVGATQTATAASNIVLSANYGPPILFTFTDSGTAKQITFYANAKITPTNFSANFAISVVYSDSADPLNTLTATGQYATVVPSSVTATNQPAPADVLGIGGIMYTRDAQNKLVTVTGNPTLATGNPAGQSYVITPGACMSALASITAAYKAGPQVPVGMPPTSADFGLVVGQSIATPIQRCMIIGNCDVMTSMICSYELYQVTFQ